MTPTGFVAAFLTALAPVVGATPTRVRWNLWPHPVRWWGTHDGGAPPGVGGAVWHLWVFIDDGAGWRYWYPSSHLDEALFAVVPDHYPADLVGDFADARRRGHLQKMPSRGRKRGRKG